MVAFINLFPNSEIVYSKYFFWIFFSFLILTFNVLKRPFIFEWLINSNFSIREK